MRIGIIGGGQLARMLIIAGYPLGLEFAVYETRAEHCVADLAPVYQPSQLEQFIATSDVITYENENIEVNWLQDIAQRKTIYPNPSVLSYLQDRLTEKNLFTELGIETNRYFEVDNTADLTTLADKLAFPFIIKTRRGGYDGKGQYVIADEAALRNLQLPINQFGYLAEAFVDFEAEYSCIAVFSHDSQMQVYDLCCNQHHKGILRHSYPWQADNQEVKAYQKCAADYLQRIAQKFNYVGILVGEFFKVGNKLLANEIAPRVHNSGHWTIEAAATSQFANHLRAIAHLPLGRTDTLITSHMSNIIGTWPDRQALLKIGNLSLHDYCKTPRPGRKLGHVTLLGTEACQQALAQLNILLETL
ncbi:MAG: 5-(carboxyamino)imidazole ribonucleotide synthase [Gammaproteobacteria bacterium]